MFKLLIGPLVLAAFCSSLYAQHSFTGVAIDSNGKALSGLNIELARGWYGSDPLFDHTVLKTRTDKDGNFTIATDWDSDVSFHVIAYSDNYFGEISEWFHRLRRRASTEVCMVCGGRHTMSLRFAPNPGADEQDPRCMVVLRSGRSTRCHVIPLPENQALALPVGEAALDVMCLASPISKEIPKVMDFAARGWMRRGEIRGAKCGDTIHVALHDFRSDGGGKFVRVKIPRLGGPFYVMGLDKSGVPIWHEAPENFWRVHCGGSDVERINETDTERAPGWNRQFIVVTIHLGERVKQLMIWDRDGKRECLYDRDDLSYEEVADVKWIPLELPQFSVQLGDDGAPELHRDRRGVEVRLFHGACFVIWVVPVDERGVIHFELPANFSEVDIELTPGSGTEFSEPRKLKAKRGVSCDYSGKGIARYHLTVRGPSGQSLASLIVPIRRVDNGKPGENFEIVLDASSSVAVYLQSGAHYEVRIGDRWLPFVADPMSTVVELSPWD